MWGRGVLLPSPSPPAVRPGPGEWDSVHQDPPQSPVPHTVISAAVGRRGWCTLASIPSDPLNTSSCQRVREARDTLPRPTLVPSRAPADTPPTALKLWLSVSRALRGYSAWRHLATRAGQGCPVQAAQDTLPGTRRLRHRVVALLAGHTTGTPGAESSKACTRRWEPGLQRAGLPEGAGPGWLPRNPEPLSYRLSRAWGSPPGLRLA